MSVFAELSTLAQESHDEYLAGDYEYRPTAADDWQPIKARRHTERTINEKSSSGWNRVQVTDFGITKTELEQPILHSHLRPTDGETVFTITQFHRASSDRWIVTCKLTRVGEAARPGMRRS